ncbi:MAG TPA: cytochrome c [Polyangiaceae bacterium]
MRAAAIVACTGVLVGCGPAPHSRAAGALTPLAVKSVAWNPTSADLGPVTAVADAGKVVAVFGSSGATVLSAGAVVARDTSVKDWVGAQAIHGADGSARWIVGVDGRGHLHYLRGLSSLDDVTARYGLDGRPVRGVAMLDAKRVGFLLDGEIAVADGGRLTRFAVPPLAGLAGGAGSGAGVGADTVLSFDAAMNARTFPLRGVTAVTVGRDGRLYATTRRALYAATEHGDLALVFDAGADTLHGLAASGDHVWFADGPELGTLDGDHVAETAGLRLAPDAGLAPSGSGDVWVLTRGALERYGRADPEAALGARWSSTLAPIFARACSSCHLPGGVSGTDLSSAEAWHSERAAIHDRVVKTRSMPPEGHPLSEADRGAIQAWVDATP